MVDLLSKIVKLLDQILPFLENSPTWLRVWIYTLIFLNCVTVAGISVFYLIAKQARAEQGTLRHFSVEQPVNNQEIPLGANQSWMLSGKFPIVDSGQNLEKKIAVKIFKMPEHESVPQNGEPLISTVDGAWRYESAVFPGEGVYEIRIAASLGGSSTFQTVTVTCKNKGTAYHDSIEHERELRGAPKLVIPARDSVSLVDVMNQAVSLQYEFYRVYLTDRNLNAAQQVVSRALDVIEPALIVYPNNHDLQNMRAYFLKDYGLILQDLNRIEEAQRYYEEAGKMFAAVREQDPKDASAWNGLGSVYILRGDPQNALQYINKALEIQPGYEEALHDREVARNLLAAQQKANVH